MILILTKHNHFKTAHQLLDKLSQRELLSSPLVLRSLLNGVSEDPEVLSHVFSWMIIYYAKSGMIRDSIEVESSERGGSTYLRSSAMNGPPGSASSAWPTILADSTISATRTR